MNIYENPTVLQENRIKEHAYFIGYSKVKEAVTVRRRKAHIISF